MANLITGVTSGTGGLSTTADASGQIALQTNNGTTALTLDNSQNATFTGNISTPTGTITASSFSGNGSALTGIATTGNYVDLTTNQTVAGNKTFSGTTTLGPYVEGTSTTTVTSSFTPTMSNGPVQRDRKSTRLNSSH